MRAWAGGLILAFLLVGCGDDPTATRQRRLADLYGKLQTLETSLDFMQRFRGHLDEIGAKPGEDRLWTSGMNEAVRRDVAWTFQQRAEVQAEIDRLESAP